MGETEDLIRKLEPVIGKDQAERYFQEYNNGRFSPTLRKAVEREVRELARQYDLDNQIILYPVPGRTSVIGDYSLGPCHYGTKKMNARFGLREQDFIKHIGIFGATGSGKTTTTMVLARQLCERGIPFLILDPKGTWQSIIRKDWAKDVKVLKVGSSYAPYTFDPFMPLPGMDIDTMISEVVEVFCDTQYLGYGAKNLLLRACYSAKGKGRITMGTVYDEFQKLHITGQKQRLWYASTQRALEAATTGVLGRVLNLPDNVLFDRLMDCQAVMVLDQLVDRDQIAMLNGLMLNRIYWHRKLAGVRERLKHLLVIEEFHALASAEKAKGESRIEFLIKMCREFSQGVMILEQNPGRISDAVLGNLNTIISMKLGHSKDITSVGSAMALPSEQRSYLSRLPTGLAICKATDRMDGPALVKVDHEVVEKSEISEQEIRAHNRDFVSELQEEETRPRPIELRELTQMSRRDKLTPLQRKILRYLKINNGANLKNLNLSLGLSYGRSDRLRRNLLRLGLIEVEMRVPTPTGHETRVYLTEKGEKYLENTEDSRRLGGAWHRSAVEAVARYYQTKGFIVRKEFRDIDLFVDKGSEELAVEVESLTGSKDYVQAVHNAIKALKRADRLEIVVRDKVSARKLRQTLEKSPMKSSRGFTIRLLANYL